MRNIKAIGGKMLKERSRKQERFPVTQLCKTLLSITVDKRLEAHEEFKRKIALEAWRDRQASDPDCDAEIRRLAFIAKIHAWCPQINPKAIAESIQPWDQELFKRKVADARILYLKELRSP